MTPLRIAVYAPLFPPFEGGAERVAARVAAELAVHHQVCVFTHRHDASIPERDAAGDATVERLPMRFRRIAGFTDLESPELERALDRWPYDVLHVQGVVFPRVAQRAVRHARRRGAPSIVVGHGIYEALAPARKHARLRSMAYGAAVHVLLRSLLATATHVVASSSNDLTHLARVGVDRRRVTIIANGVDVPAPNPGAAERFRARHGLGARDVVLHVGNVKPGKGHDVVTRALPALIASHPRVAYVAVGGTTPLWQSYADEVVARWSQPDMAEHVRYLGHVADDEVSSAFGAADVALLASSQETLPLALLEAMAHGKAVVATSVGGVSTVVQDGRNGLLVPPDDPTALANAVARMLRDPASRRTFGEAARATVEQGYTWASVAGSYEELSLRLVEAARLPRAVGG